MDDIGDATIKFDENGYCDYCKEAMIRRDLVYLPNEQGEERLSVLADNLKKAGKGKKYDCILGLSGGLDSSYAAYVGHKMGLRMLAVHVDDGFDIAITTQNVKNLCEAFSIDLIVEKPNARQFYDLTRAYLLAGVPNIAVPQDNVIFACLYRYAHENAIKHFISGSNFALECILQRGNTYDASDKVQMRAIHKKYGRIQLTSDFPMMSVFEKRIKYGLISGVKAYKPLNYVDYNAKSAFEILNKECGFEYYGDKHCESILTKLMQRYYLPAKFNVDKRKSHYSSMIISGQMTREEALERLKEPLYDPEQLEKDIDFVINRLGISRSEFTAIMAESPRSHDEYAKSLINRMAPYVLKARMVLIKR